ncbi:MAG: carboxypeptidase regulatory-like domain-containing protein [Planctomycetes bacterium]|nr:carboxypeptidase regulatory-like domain-containing protein [Planctomycetota bacterium]
MAADGETGEPVTRRQPMEADVVEIPVPDKWFAGQAELRVSVGIAGPAHRKVVVEGSLKRGQVLQVSLLADPGLQISGRVTTADGEPVHGLEVVARRRRRSPGVKTSTGYDTEEYLYSSFNFEEARAVTAGDGSFALSGLAENHYFLTTSDMAWSFVPASRPGIDAPSEGVELVAERSLQLRLRVVDSSSHQPVPAARVRMQVEGKLSTGFPCTEGLGHVALARVGSALRQGRLAEIPARIQAFGYAPAAISFTIPPGAAIVEQLVELDPLPVHTCRFAIPSATSLACTFNVTAMRSGEQHVRALKPTKEPGIFETELPEGAWRVRVFPSGAISQYALSWEGSLVHTGPTTVPVQVEMPAFGRLDVAGWTSGAFLLQLTFPERRVTAGVEAGSHTFFVPAGAWAYRASVRGDLLEAGHVEVRAGSRTVLAVNRE